MKATNILSITSQDKFGYKPEEHLLGTLWAHQGNGKVYRITNFSFDASVDEWSILYVDIQTTTYPTIYFCRPRSNFFTPGKFLRIY